MKYAKPQKYVFGERPAKPPYGKQVFTKIVNRSSVFDREQGKRRLIADRWEIYAHTTPGMVVLIGRVYRNFSEGTYSAEFIHDGITIPWCEVKNITEARREAARYVGIKA